MIANTPKRKNDTIRMLMNYTMEFRRVFIKIFIVSITYKFFRGLKSLKALIPEKPLIPGIWSIIADTTTIRSNQFQASLR